MRTLKFEPSSVTMIQTGQKTTTWRLFDDKDLQTGDVIVFINKATGEEFGTGRITWISVRTLGTLTDEDMYARYKTYYPDKEVGPGTIVKGIFMPVLK